MDYFSRLVGGAPSPTRHPTVDSQQRSTRFNKLHDQLQHIWRKLVSSKQPVPVDQVLFCIDNIFKALQDEVQAPGPHLCARHAYTFRTYTTLAQVASKYHDEAVIRRILDIYGLLIESEEIEFLKEKAFADALISFTSNVSTTGSVLVSIEIEGRIAELLFAIASRIKLQPGLVSTWFRPQTGTAAQTQQAQSFAIDKGAFPLFDLTLDYVHHHGIVGDFARTALLYIIETTAHSDALEKWIVDSDLATLMASGLGALYSQLSRKLVLSFSKNPVPTIVSFSQAMPPSNNHDAEETASPDLQAHLSTFLSYLVFWQDMLEHCHSDDVKQSLLDHFKLLFLQQLLYPSLVESSDRDGGSSVAVLTYLRCIIESIDHPDLLDVTLRYLLALPEKSEEISKSARPTTLARRRKSSMLITNLAQGQEKPMPDLFTLVDLVLTSLQSHDAQTITATLQLISIILGNQHQYAVMSIVKTQPDLDQVSKRTLNLHQRDLDTLQTMAEDLMEHDDLAEAYDVHLQDARTLLMTHCCSPQLLALPNVNVPYSKIQQSDCPLNGKTQPHSIRADDNLLKSLNALLDNFLGNDVNTNLSLTKTYSVLASCGNTRLSKWLLSDDTDSSASIGGAQIEVGLDQRALAGAENNLNPVPTNSNNQNIEQYKDGLIQPSCTGPPVLATLDCLVHRVERLRREIHELDIFVGEQRHMLRVGDDIDHAVANGPAPGGHSENHVIAESSKLKISQGRGVGQIGSISGKLMYDSHSSNDSRSSSPRGRQPSDRSRFAFAERLNQLQISPSPSPSIPASRAFSPSPLRTDIVASTPPHDSVAPKESLDAVRLKTKIKIRDDNACQDVDTTNVGDSETSSIRSESTAQAQDISPTSEVALGQVLTNIIILQEFILELAAIIEVRASLFHEVNFIDH